MRPSARLLVSACAAALLFGSAPALAQVGTPALPVALAPIPTPRDAPYPGVIGIELDATDIDRRIVSVKQTIPVTAPGPLVLLYPEWIPGNHGPVGPVDDIADLQITANGQPLRWVRNTVQTTAFQVEVPAGVSSLEVTFKWLTPIDGSQGRVVITDEMLNIQWEKALLYPAGYY
ncbi:MAG: peptidase M61, partial [Brevundimonas sp.]